MKEINEKGYALPIVLFATIFILLIVAVFMRGALSNAKQEIAVDESNLTVATAEAGVDYYTWELKQVYDENALESEFNKLVNKAIENEETPIDYVRIQERIANDFQIKLEDRISGLINEGTTELLSEYNHKLFAANVDWSKSNGEILLKVNGTVEGELPQSANQQKKEKQLKFELVFKFPKVQLADGGLPVDPGDASPPDGSLVVLPTLKEPKTPARPTAIVGISKPAGNCNLSSNSIATQQCSTSGVNVSDLTINKSGVFVDNTLNSWGVVKLENSFVNILKDFTPAEFKIDNTELVVGGKMVAYQAANINKSKIQANSLSNSGGTASLYDVQMNITNTLEFQSANIENSTISTKTYKANSQTNFNNTDFTVAANYNSTGASFKNSTIEVGGTVNSGGGLFYVEGSNFRIAGDAHTANGSTIKNSVLSIGGYFLHTSKPLDVENSDISVGGKVTATNGTNLRQVNMNVLGDYQSSTAFKLAETNLIIKGKLTLGNGGSLENSLLTASRIESNTPLVLKDSTAVSDYLWSDIMRIENSEVCSKDFNVRDLNMDNKSKIYYLNSSNHTNDNIIKLTSEQFEKTCGIKNSTKPEEPEQPGTINWKAPVLDKVIY